MILPVCWSKGFNRAPYGSGDWFERQLSDLFGPDSGTDGSYPALNVWGNENEWVLTAELPGVQGSDLSLTIEDNQLILGGTRKSEDAPDDAHWLSRERNFGTFDRTFRLPFDIEEKKVTARFTDGVLRIVLPRKEETKPRNINVSKD